MNSNYNGNKLSYILSQQARREFDPAKEQDRSEFKYFLQNSKWKSKSCPFILEYPFLDIPTMVHHKLSKHLLKI